MKEEVKITTGAGKDQGGVDVVAVPVGAGPGGEEGMDLDV